MPERAVICRPCLVGSHGSCNGEARIYHVGGAVDVVPCSCALDGHPISLDEFREKFGV